MFEHDPIDSRECSASSFWRRWIPAGARVLAIGAVSAGAAEAALEQAFLSAEPLVQAKLRRGKLSQTGELAGLEPDPSCDVLVFLGALSASRPDQLHRQALALTRISAGTVLVLWPDGSRPLAAGHYCALFEQLGFSSIQTALPGSEAMVLLRNDVRTSARANLTGIIENDKKTTTYKFALLRALCDINIACPGRAAYLPKATLEQAYALRLPYRALDAVEVPFSLVIESVMGYYWNILANYPHLRQIQSGRMLGFERELLHLIQRYGGDWLTLRRDWYAGRLNEASAPDDVIDAFSTAFEMIATTLYKGPINHAGSSMGPNPNDPEQHKEYLLFQTSGKTRGARRSVLTPDLAAKWHGTLRLPASLWRELNFVAPYAADAITLEWASLSARFTNLSGGKATIGDALCALMPPEDKRDVAIAKSIYEGAVKSHHCRCVWSAKELRPAELAVDHLLPWSRTHTNDLWNLVPAARLVNSQKSDKLPTPELLDHAAPQLYEAWRQIDRSSYGGLFRAQAENHFLGTELLKSGWEHQLLDAVMRTSDIVARQFSAQRWSGPTQLF